MKKSLAVGKRFMTTELRTNSGKGWRRGLALVVAVLFSLYPVMPASFNVVAKEKLSSFPASALSSIGGCNLKSARGQVQHVIYIQFDNTHFTRDNANVPSDLELMPHLLLKGMELFSPIITRL